MDLGGPLWMIGCGNMGGAMLRRWIAAGLDPAGVTVVTRTGANVPAGVATANARPEAARPAIVVLAVKPQQLNSVAPMLAETRPPLLVSILAGVEVATLLRRVPADAVLRAMPNLPVAIGKGVVAFHTRAADPAIRAIGETMAAPLGIAEWIEDEAAFDAVTALAGSGPGFTFRFVDALTVAGTSLGLARDQAERLALATVAGAAEMARQADDPPAVLAERVASRGGSTRAGLDVLDREDALATLLARTLAATEARNRAMAAEAR